MNSNNMHVCNLNQNNLSYPILRAKPSFGDGMRVHVDGVTCESLKEFWSHGKMSVEVEWGTYDGERDAFCELTIHGVGRRPGYQLFAKSPSTVGSYTQVTWSIKTTPYSRYPEYLATLRIWNGNGNQNLLLERNLHVLPPIFKLDYNINDIFSVPKKKEENEDQDQQQDHNETTLLQQRRGFGLELETIQLPPDPDVSGCFTIQEEFQLAIETHTSSVGNMKQRLMLWDVARDPQVFNGALQARIDAYEKYQNQCHNDNKKDENTTFAGLLLGGDKQQDLPNNYLEKLPRHFAQASPEYKSPLPPNELYHSFPPHQDAADREIQALLKVIKASKPIYCPTVSDVGQSASSIHVHVNVCNPNAFPRQHIQRDELLSVVLGWIQFDNVTRIFSKPWMWRERAMVPMYPSGPEFWFHEIAWKQGTTIDLSKTPDMYNTPAFFRHLWEHQHGTFEEVFDNSVIESTLFRKCSLNLCALKKYGTVEFRRMHATLHPGFINAWTRFCVGFVELFAKHYDKFAMPYLSAANWQEGLTRLVEAQNRATLEDLVELMAPVVLPNTFRILLQDYYSGGLKTGKTSCEL